MDAKRGVDFIGVTTPFVIHDGKGNFLLQKRSQKCRDERGRWDVGGGSMEFGETWEESVRREVKEEIGVEPIKVEFIYAFNALRDNNGTPTHWVALVHAAQVDPNKVKIIEKDKIDEIDWFTMKTLPKPLHSQIMNGLIPAQKAGIIK